MYGHAFWLYVNFLSSLIDTKRDEKRQNTSYSLDDPALQKWTQTFKNFVCWSSAWIALWESELLSWHESTKKLIIRFCVKHSTWTILDLSPGQCANSYHFVWEYVPDKTHYPPCWKIPHTRLAKSPWLLFVS